MKRIGVFAYRYNTSYDVDLLILFLADTAALRPSVFRFTGDEQFVFFHYYPHVNPADPSTGAYPYLLTSGEIVVASVTPDDIQGTFSGRGSFAVSPTDTIAITSGVFHSSLEAAGATEPLLPAAQLVKK